jgi:tRNA modification GTPase
MLPPESDTIVAVATPRGEGGVGIVRLSGPAALRLARQLFQPRSGELPLEPLPRHLYYGDLCDEAGAVLDEGLCAWFPAPHSYTAEDVVEFSAHGSDIGLARLVEAARRLGARLAAPGEFTQRAFLNGRLDLARAEAVVDIIRARTEDALRVAGRQLEGRLSRAIREVRATLIGLLAAIEAAIDFPDDVDPPAPAALAAGIAASADRVHHLLATADAGRLYREGASVVIAGRPNVGKSSLLNALLGEERAIVTPVAGTTRDVIEEGLSLGGVPVRAIDTAGLRDTEDPVERLGVSRTRAELARADLTLLVVDAAAGLTDADRALMREREGRWILVANKIDRGDVLTADLRTGVALVRVSALTGEGLDRLVDAIRTCLVGGELGAEPVLVTNARHRAALAAAARALADADAGAAAGADLAAVAVDLKIAAESLGDITGESVTEETIAQIFARFCVGK